MVSQLLINFHEEPLSIIKLDASSRKAGQDSGNRINGRVLFVVLTANINTNVTNCHRKLMGS